LPSIDELEHAIAIGDPGCKFVVARTESARRAVREFTRGGRLVGFTRGQFSLLDLMRALLLKTGPVDVVISTWTAGIRDAQNARWLARRGAIRSLMFLVDRSFASRQPKYARKLADVFGDEAVRYTRTHAKFALLTNDDWSVCVRSSMNLNTNARFEQFDIDDNAELCAFVREHVDELIARAPPGWNPPRGEVERGFARTRRPLSKTKTARAK